MRALSIRQPYAELILRGIKTIEYRSRATTIIGERYYLYAAKTKTSRVAWSRDLAVAMPPAWLVELARQVRMIEPSATLPAGVIVGSAVIERVSQTADGIWQWHLAGVERAKKLRKPIKHPQPAWFQPF